MALKFGGFKRKSKVVNEIPNSSLADIAFLLLIFFMLSTTFRTGRERPIEWPTASATQRVDETRDGVLHVWVERNGDVYINDRLIAAEDVATIVAPLWVDSGEQLVISLRADAEVPYRYVHQVQDQLRRVGAVYVVFATELERRIASPN